MHYCVGIRFESLFFWMFIAGLFFGAGLAVITINSRKKRNPARTRRLKPVFLSVFFSCGFFALAGAGIISGFQPLLSNPREVGIFFLVCAGTGFLGFRFKKSAGFVLLITVLAGVITTAVVTRGWVCVDESVPVLSFSVLARLEGEAALEVEGAGLQAQGSLVQTVPYDEAVFIFESVNLHEAIFFVRSPHLVRFIGFGDTAPESRRFTPLFDGSANNWRVPFWNVSLGDYSLYEIPFHNVPRFQQYHIKAQEGSLKLMPGD